MNPGVVGVEPQAGEEGGQETDPADREDEGQRQRHAGEVGCHAREGHQRAAQRPWQATGDDGVGHEEPEDPSGERGDEADLDAGQVGVELQPLGQLRGIFRA